MLIQRRADMPYSIIEYIRAGHNWLMAGDHKAALAYFAEAITQIGQMASK